jgi:polyhydroxybutyrate depolymerase
VSEGDGQGPPMSKLAGRKTILGFFLGAVSLLFPFCPARAQSPPDLLPQSLFHDGRERTWYLYVPEAVRQAQVEGGTSSGEAPPVPLVVALHGGGETVLKAAEVNGFTSLADTEGFIVAYPRAVRWYWNDGRDDPITFAAENQVDDVGFISKVIDRVLRDYNVDPSRIYVVGHSNGGMMALRIGCELTDKIAAVGSVIAALPEDLSSMCDPSRSVPIVMIAGTDDPLVPWEGGEVTVGDILRGRVISVPETVEFWRRRNYCGTLPVLSELPDRDRLDGTTVTLRAYRDCAGLSDVFLYQINGGGHRWPGRPALPLTEGLLADSWFGRLNRDIDATSVIWDFFNNHPLPPVSFPLTPVTALDADGDGCPMSHCNQRVDDFQKIAPLDAPVASTKIDDPDVGSNATVLLGCTTGKDMAVCAYNAMNAPGLVAYDLRSGEVLWTSAPDDFPMVGGVGAFPGRLVLGLLIANVTDDSGAETTRVFAANPAEYVAYDSDGNRLWKRPSDTITPLAPEGIAAPIALSFSDDNELITATRGGWIVKLHPSNGETIDAYKLDTNVFVKGVRYGGTLINRNVFSIVGNVLYLSAEFRSEPSSALRIVDSPVYLVRLQLSQPGVPGAEHKIKPLAVPLRLWDPRPDRIKLGVRTGGGSPTTLVLPDGRALIVADADRWAQNALRPTITVVEDDNGVLTELWHSSLTLTEPDNISASPAVYAQSGTLIVSTLRNIYVFRNIDRLRGAVPAPAAFRKRDLITCGGAQEDQASIRVGSPIALAFDEASNELVAYTNFKIKRTPEADTFSFLGAFTVPMQEGVPPHALWCKPLALSAAGEPAPGMGTSGQPALFEYEDAGGRRSGVIVNTFSSGTFIFRSGGVR